MGHCAIRPTRARPWWLWSLSRLKAITLGKLRHSNISRMRAAGIAADVVAAWHGHTERMTQAVYGRVTDDRLTAGSAVFSAVVGQS